MSKIETPLLKKFLKNAGDKLAGNWVLLGGSVIPLLGENIRTTHDIDLAGFGPKEQAQTLKLLELAENLQLPIEAINQAAGFFLQKIPNWKGDLILIQRGAKASIYRPNATLYLCLKLNRFSESDLDDCLAMIRIAKNLKEAVDRERLIKAIHTRRSKDDHALTKRLDLLTARLKVRK